eukprot:8715887-Pyramimonas_sp.AAC.1
MKKWHDDEQNPGCGPMVNPTSVLFPRPVEQPRADLDLGSTRPSKRTRTDGGGPALMGGAEGA